MLGMSRRKDLPAILSRLNPVTKSPAISVWATGLIIALLVLTGDITFTWSFSAFTVLIYYAITNLSSWMLDKEQRLYRSEEHTSELQSRGHLVCRLLLEKKKQA